MVHVQKIGGEEGVIFVKKTIYGVETAQNKIAAKICGTMHRVYWDMIEKEMNNETSRYPCMLMLTKTIVEKLQGLTNNDERKTTIRNDIDVTYYEVKVINNSFSLETFREILTQSLKHLQLLCSPSQDAELRSLQNMLEKDEFTILSCLKVTESIFSHTDYVERQREKIMKQNEQNEQNEHNENNEK